MPVQQRRGVGTNQASDQDAETTKNESSDIFRTVVDLFLGIGISVDTWKSSLRMVMSFTPLASEAREQLKTKKESKIGPRTYEVTRMNPNYLISCINASRKEVNIPPTIIMQPKTVPRKRRNKRNQSPSPAHSPRRSLDSQPSFHLTEIQESTSQAETAAEPLNQAQTSPLISNEPEHAPDKERGPPTKKVTVFAGNMFPVKHSSHFCSRRHPASYQPANAPDSPHVSCLLFRPQEGASLQNNRLAVARDLQRLEPLPLAVRKIREGGIAVVFSLGPSLDTIKAIAIIAGIPVIIEPPRRKQGTSGAIRGDFSAAEEVYELYSIHTENPTITKVEKLGEKSVFRLFFEDALPTSVHIFFNRTQVEPYYQHPIRCFRCSGFNHRAADCRRLACCSLCAEPDHSHKECPKQLVRCVNCGGPHPATNRTCSHRLFHRKVTKTAFTSGISIQAARTKTAASYADILKKRPAQSLPETANTNPRRDTTAAIQSSTSLQTVCIQLLKSVISGGLDQDQLTVLYSSLRILLPQDQADQTLNIG